MVNDEKIKQYIRWFDNLSFFGNDSFILEQIENFWNLVNLSGKAFYPFDKLFLRGIDYSNITLDETIILAQRFFDIHNIKINIKELISENILILELENKDEKDDFYNIHVDGNSYMENNQKKVKVCLKGNILDCMVIIHEIMHYLNQPYEKRNTVSDFLTESISYGCELIFLEDCLRSNYDTDADLHYTIIEKTFYDICYYIYYIYKVILIYKYEKDINEDLYKKHFDDDGYNRTLNYFEKYVSCHKLIVRDSWVIIGIPLAIYMLEEYKKDKSFFDKIIDFNNSINDKSLDECLKVLNINDFNDLYDKISVSLSNYAENLTNIYKKYGEEQKVI